MTDVDFPRHQRERLCVRASKTGLALDGILVQQLVQLVHNNGPGRIHRAGLVAFPYTLPVKLRMRIRW